MFRVIDELIGGTTDLARSVVNLMAVLMVIAVWAKSRKPGPTVAAIALGAFAVWGVHNFDRLESLIDEQIDEADKDSGDVDEDQHDVDDDDDDDVEDDGDTDSGGDSGQEEDQGEPPTDDSPDSGG